MRFWSKYTHARYVMVPDDYQEAGRGRTKKVAGIAAVFESNMWDSERAQKENRWDDETRAELESYLMDHEDYGKTLRSVSDSEMAQVIQTANRPANCLFTRTVDGEVWLCGQPAVSDDGYCERHAIEIDDAPKAKPNRRQTAPA